MTVLMTLGLRWDQIQDPGTGKKHDSVSSEEPGVGELHHHCEALPFC